MIEFSRNPNKMAYTAAASAAALVAGFAAREALKSGWRATRGDDPPINPAHPDTGWADAVAWSVAVGVGMGLARLLAQRTAASGWRSMTGSLPPGLEQV